MSRAIWLSSLLLLALVASPASADILRPIHNWPRINNKICGTVIDHTHHHGADRRIWSEALCQKRDLYVYLPPGYDPAKQYPIMIWLHGFVQDENAFIDTYVVHFDKAIACGRLPPMIIAAPDGTSIGRASFFAPNSFFINSNAGNFEDYLIHDVWNFLVEHYPIRPEREAHVLGGVSMGGFAAFNQAIKHRDLFKTCVGIYPPLNLRWLDCHGRYRGNFDPNCWGWRQDISRRREVIGRFGLGVVKVRLKRLIEPLFDRDDPDAINKLAAENPIEMIDRLCLRNGELNMFVVYGTWDEFNLDAQIDSFLYRARERGIRVDYIREPRGHHNTRTAMRLLPCVINWMGDALAPYRHDNFLPDLDILRTPGPPEAEPLGPALHP